MLHPSLIQQFITLWVVIDPVGTLPVFLAVTAGASTRTARRIAVRAVLVAFAVLLGFLVFGQIVIEALGVALPSFQIAGGLVLFLFALTMIFGASKPAAEIAEVDRLHSSVFPLAIPSMASPGAMLAVVVLTDNRSIPLAQQTATAGLMALVMVATLAILLLAAPIQRVIGTTGASVISRVMGILLATVAVDAVLRGFAAIGAIPAF